MTLWSLTLVHTNLHFFHNFIKKLQIFPVKITNLIWTINWLAVLRFINFFVHCTRTHIHAPYRNEYATTKYNMEATRRKFQNFKKTMILKSSTATRSKKQPRLKTFIGKHSLFLESFRGKYTNTLVLNNEMILPRKTLF